jgi:uncharacterized protein with ParB-like and HNH nuclease domain
MDRVDYQPIIIQDIINLNNRKELDLRPWYQRRVVWTPQQQAYLINTILEQKPVPSIYIRHSIDIGSGKSIREVVDGQQRLVAVLEYVADKFGARHPKHAKPVKFSLLSKQEKHQFLTTALSVGYLLGAQDSDVIEIFGRINSVSKKLLPAEKRNANFSGEFKQFSVRQASARVDFWRNNNIFSALQIARMSEMQFVSELAINMIEGLQDYNPKKIDEFYKRNDEKFGKETEITRRFDATFGLLVSLNDTTLKDTIFSRPPIFFSLFLILDSIKNKITVSDLRNAMGDMDARFESEKKTKADLDFYVACRSNPHRILSRQARDKYIRTFIG